MRKFDASELANLLHMLHEARDYAQNMCVNGYRDVQVPDAAIASAIEPMVAMARAHASKMELHSTLDRVADSSGYFVTTLSKGITFQNLGHELTVLRQSIDADLGKRYFVFIRPEKAKILEEMPTQWRQIWRKLPNCKIDTQEAVFCYCTENNTASVFHSVRVSEHGLRNVAWKFGVRLKDKGKPQPVDYATWTKIIDEIKTKISAAHALPQGPRKSRKLQFHSRAADDCTFIRDIWRNDVSHTRKHYNAAQALQVLTRVRDFMQSIVMGRNSI